MTLLVLSLPLIYTLLHAFTMDLVRVTIEYIYRDYAYITEK